MSGPSAEANGQENDYADLLLRASRLAMQVLEHPDASRVAELVDAVEELIKTIDTFDEMQAQAKAEKLVDALATESRRRKLRGPANEFQQELQRVKRERALRNPLQRVDLTESKKERLRAFAERLR
jgi:hypothetical protein